jgi:hypothetical protein
MTKFSKSFLLAIPVIRICFGFRASSFVLGVSDFSVASRKQGLPAKFTRSGKTGQGEGKGIAGVARAGGIFNLEDLSDHFRELLLIGPSASG